MTDTPNQPGSRKPHSNKRRRTELVGVRLSPREFDALAEHASRRGVSLGEAVRECLFSAEAELLRARAQVAAVEALHFSRGRNILGQPVCNECSPLQPMPCPTLRALSSVEVPDHA